MTHDSSEGLNEGQDDEASGTDLPSAAQYKSMITDLENKRYASLMKTMEYQRSHFSVRIERLEQRNQLRYTLCMTGLFAVALLMFVFIMFVSQDIRELKDVRTVEEDVAIAKIEWSAQPEEIKYPDSGVIVYPLPANPVKEVQP